MKKRVTHELLPWIIQAEVDADHLRIDRLGLSEGELLTRLMAEGEEVVSAAAMLELPDTPDPGVEFDAISDLYDALIRVAAAATCWLERLYEEDIATDPALIEMHIERHRAYEEART